VESLARGEALGRYIVIERLGAGAMGVVYAAYDPELDRKVAIKILRSHEGRGEAREIRRRARLEREAKAIAKLAHPHVVSIFDVGVDHGRVFLAMEYLGGGTLRAWLGEKKRPWREVVKMFVAVGRGLAAAHAEGLVHRDFKPDNVLLDRAGTPKVVDFGLARPSSGSSGGDGESTDGLLASSESAPASLTQTGTLAGTPAYMAPEQFMSREADSRSDQFAFCVALYEALYGQRPFAGDTVFDLAESILHERVDATPKSANVPGWIRRSLLRGLRADREQRWKKLEDLLVALEADPVARARRIVAASLVTVAVVSTIGGLYRRSEHRRLEFEGRVASKLKDGRQALAEAGKIKTRLLAERKRAFRAFDGGRRDEGESVWAEARRDVARLEGTLNQAQAGLEAALALDQSNERAREALGDALFERAWLAELEVRRGDLSHLLEQMNRIDASGALRARWTLPGQVVLETTPPGARVVIERYDPASDERGAALVLVPVMAPPVAPGEWALPPGSYRVTAAKDGYAEVRYPFVVRRGEPVHINLRLLPAKEVPPDFVYVPEGLFLNGDADEDFRLGFLNAAPLHERTTPAFLMKAHETTFGEWLEFLRELPVRERRTRIPASFAVQGSAVVRGDVDSGWSLELNISGPRLIAREKSPIVYVTRHARASQDWLRMPVLGVSPKDMQAYVEWLSRTGRVTGARFCNELEWERAARGADDRSYPASLTRLGSDDANIDLTYGRVRGSYGPDEVGSHPASRSPFGIDDLAGNAWEVVESRDDGGGYLIRGGSYYHASTSARATNREGIDRETRSYIVGMRVCAAVK
jgi:serine/threonine protein kinase/formylglycine-generating enzyme required for sulfatase activity